MSVVIMFWKAINYKHFGIFQIKYRIKTVKSDYTLKLKEVNGILIELSVGGCH